MQLLHRQCNKRIASGICSVLLFLACLTGAHADRLKVGTEYIRTGELRASGGDVLLAVPAESDGSEMILQVSVPDFRVEETAVQGRIFQRLHIKGYGFTSQPGLPLLPRKGFHIAIPEGSTALVEVMASESTSETGYVIYPVPRMIVTETEDGSLQSMEEFYHDDAAYATSRLYPERIAEIGSYGSLRDVRFVRITVSPIQFNPASGELRIHRRIWLKVTLFGGTFAEGKAARAGTVDKRAPFGAVYERLMLNHSDGISHTRPIMRPHRRYGLEYLDGFSYKLAVKEDGIYRIVHQDLLDAGINPSAIDPRTIKLYYCGGEVAIHVYDETDGTLDPGDYIEFFGLRNRSEFSDSSIYWLSWGGGDGMRMAEVDCSPGDSLSVPASFIQKYHFEEDKRYFCCVYMGEGIDHWYWDRLYGPTMKDFQVILPDVAAGSNDVNLTVKLLGKTFGTHRTKININSEPVADETWAGAYEHEITVSFPHAYLEDGLNYLILQVPTSGGGADQSFFNWFEIEYERYYRAYEDTLRFIDSNSGPNQIEIEGFTKSEIELLRITNPGDVERMTGFVIESDGPAYTLIFEETVDDAEYFAFASDRKLTPDFLGWYEPAHLRSSGNRADYLIITHEDFIVSAERLKNYREGDGLDVEVVDVVDIYDEFSYGNFDPNAIRDFLEYTYFDWTGPAPSYVLLLGDASYDYSGNLAHGNINYVPTHLFVSQSEYVETSSDDWFACLVGGDRLPDMLVGRLAVQTAAEAETIVDKIIGYESALPQGDWLDRVLLVADNPDLGGDFEGISDVLADEYFAPAGFDTVKCYVSRCHPACTQCIIDHIDNGAVICNFLGHGSIDTWTSEQIFLSDDVSSLGNGNLLPLLVTFTCLNGFFHSATDDNCLAEEFHRAPGGGSIASWAHSGLDWAYSSGIIGECFYDALINDGNTFLGAAVCQAKACYLATDPYYWDQAMMLILFGDPALRMAFSATPDLVPANITFNPAVPVVGTVDTVTATLYNAGRGLASDITVQFSNGHPDSAGSTIIGTVPVPYLEAGGRVPVSALWDSVPDVGSYAVYVMIDPEDEIAESGEWNNLLWDTLRVRSAGDVLDTIPPIVELFVEEKKVGSDFSDYDYASSNPLIEAHLIDHESGVDIDEISLTLNGQPKIEFELEHGGNGSETVTLRYQPGFLEDSEYTLVVGCRDTCIVPNAASAAVTFVVESHIRLRETRNYPNPWSNDTRFYYYLSQQTEDVTIHIYSVTGALIKTIHRAPGDQNANVVFWNGCDQHGVAVASGVYFYTIVASGVHGSDKASGKMVLIR